MSTSTSSFAGESKHGGTRQRRQVDTTNKTESLNEKPNIKKNKRKHRPAWKRLARFSLKHRWTIPLVPLIAIVLAYLLNPTESNIVHHFLFLSYKFRKPGSQSPQYGKGLWDIAFVLFYTIFLSFTRELIMQEFLRPLSIYYGIKSKAKQLRYMEQMYTVIYFGLMGPLGLYVMRHSVPEVWYFNTSGMYSSFPHRSHDAMFKFYYLFEAAYWAQQALVMILGLEKPRKDYKELVVHHVVTLALIGLSYRFHFTYMGIAVYVTHDVSDFFLAVSSPICFLKFEGCWLIGLNCRSANLCNTQTVPLSHRPLLSVSRHGSIYDTTSISAFSCPFSPAAHFRLSGRMNSIGKRSSTSVGFRKSLHLGCWLVCRR